MSEPRCYFCGKPVYSRHSSRHHVLPQRYFGRQEDADLDNVEIAHRKCHMKWHRLYDHPGMRAVEYCDYVKALNWGKLIFA